MTDFNNELKALQKQYRSKNQKQTLLKEESRLQRKAESEGDKAWSLYISGKIAQDEERYDISIKIFDKLWKGYGNSKSIGDIVLGIRGLFGKALTFRQNKKLDEEINIYDEVVKRFGDSAEVELKEQVAMALFNKGSALGKGRKIRDSHLLFISRFATNLTPARSVA
jgi:tetratricopeptide (TPR) repeat protein